MIEPLYCLNTHSFLAWLIRRTAGGFVVGLVGGLVVRPLVLWIRRSLVR